MGRVRQFGAAPRKRIYLISPKDPDSFWSMRSTVRAVGARALMPSNTLATLVALTPPDLGIEYVYCDENLHSIDWQTACDLVALTGYTLHSKRLGRISRAWRERGVPVALGGAFASLLPEQAAKLADHLFIGEAEHTWPRFLREFVTGRAGQVYEQKTKVDLAHSPPPDWFFIDARDYLYLTVQTSRGCPNRCDFCDAIQLVGRRYRTKSIDQIMLEVENAQRAGAETIFFSEDNFFVKPGFTRQLLGRIIEFNTRLAHPVQFSCQTSIRIADEEQILKLLADARFAALFIGIESVREDCLAEVNKAQLHRPDLAVRIRRLSSYGLLPLLGLIVGFDHDDPDTFDEIERFLCETHSPIASLSVLNAPEGTPLHARLSAQGRIDTDFAGYWHHSTNIKPLQWPLEELLERQRRLFRRLYEPEQFEPRALAWLANVSYRSDLYKNKRRAWTNLTKVARILTHYTFRVPPEVRRLFFNLLKKTWALGSTPGPQGHHHHDPVLPVPRLRQPPSDSSDRDVPVTVSDRDVATLLTLFLTVAIKAPYEAGACLEVRDWMRPALSTMWRCGESSGARNSETIRIARWTLNSSSGNVNNVATSLLPRSYLEPKIWALKLKKPEQGV